jgi:methylmalonyl-CoA/ethylmalonyl-CoA epimerase
MTLHPLDLFGPGTTFHHVGLVVPDIDAAAPGIEKTHDPIQRVNVAFVDLHGSVVELIEPAGEKSPVAASLKKGIKLVHLCYMVPSIEKAIAHAELHECRQVSEPAPAVAFDGRRIVWTYHPTYGLIELIEANLQTVESP